MPQVVSRGDDRMIGRFLAIVAALGTVAPGAIAAVPAAGRVIAQCPLMLKPGMPLPAGAKLFGRLPAGGARVGTTGMTNDAPATARPAERPLNEIEPDDQSGIGFDRRDPRPLSVFCRYGKPKPPLEGDAVLLAPIAAGLSGRCRFARQTLICTAR